MSNSTNQQGQPNEKLPIYPTPSAKPQLVEYHTVLESHVGDARRGLLSATQSAREGVHGLVSKWIDGERKVERRVQSLVPSNEPLTPGLLYLGVGTLAGSVFTRYRSLPLRFLAPPTLFFFLLPRTNPQLSENLGSYYKDLESQYLPAVVKSSRESVFQSWRDLKAQIGNGVKSVEEGTKTGWEKAKEGAEGVTGLKVVGK